MASKWILDLHNVACSVENDLEEDLNQVYMLEY